MTFRFTKSKAPAQLRDWIRQSEPVTGKVWKELPGEVKSAVRTRLHTDQRGFCCYCYTLVTDDDASHIEHMEPQSDGNRFDWDNLALACEGGNRSGNPAHCDHAKQDQNLHTVHAYRAPVVRCVRLRSTGKLTVDGEARRDVEDVLNLNARHLQRIRQGALSSAALHALKSGKRQGKSRKSRLVQQLIDDLRRRKNEPIEYQPLIEGWLERRLRQED